MPVKMLFDIYLFCRQEAYEPSCIGLFMRAVPGIDSRRKASWIGGRRETAIDWVRGGALPYLMMMIHTLHTPSIKIDTRA